MILPSLFPTDDNLEPRQYITHPYPIISFDWVYNRLNGPIMAYYTFPIGFF
jgi:hypothetical protein